MALPKMLTVPCAVFEGIDFNTSMGPLTLELTNFRLFNINPVMQQDAEQKFRNFGTNFGFKLPNQLARPLSTKTTCCRSAWKGASISCVVFEAAPPMRFNAFIYRGWPGWRN